MERHQLLNRPARHVRADPAIAPGSILRGAGESPSLAERQPSRLPRREAGSDAMSLVPFGARPWPRAETEDTGQERQSFWREKEHQNFGTPPSQRLQQLR